MELSYAFQVLQTTRRRILDILETAGTEKLLHIPPGFKNNLLWNAGHVIATQQLLMYGRAQVDPVVPAAFIDTFRKGTAGQADYPPEIIEQVKTGLTQTALRAAMDCQNDLFRTYEPYETSFGVKLNNIREAVTFNNVHEGLHLGYMMALGK